MVGVNELPVAILLIKVISAYHVRFFPVAVNGTNVAPSWIAIFPPVIGAVGLALIVKVTATGKLFTLFSVCVT